MAFCGPIESTHRHFGGVGASTASLEEPNRFERDMSAFGDAYSIKSRASFSTMPSRYHDEPEADYDDGATELYRCIENKDWDGALSRLEKSPVESKTWVFRREYEGNKVRWRLLPIHAVCIFRAPLAIIEALIEVYPDGPQMKDDQGMLPLHLACRNGASKGVVLTLLSAFPSAIHIRDRKGRSPKDLIETSNSANKEAVLTAIKRFHVEMGGETPNCSNTTTQSVRSETNGSIIPIQQHQTVVREVDYENRTVLFRLILKKDWIAAEARAADYPDEASTWIVTKGFNGNLRFLPLHKACVLQPPESLIAALLDAYPEGGREKDQDGWLPIHCACFYNADEKVVNALLVANPKGSQAKDDEGRLPLHYACLKGSSKAVVDVLLASYAKAAMIKDDEGRLAIHHACSKSAPENIIEALLKVSPKGAQSKDEQGRLALHHACRRNASERVIRILLRIFPRAAQIKDDQDKLPIHYACQHGAGGNVVSLLLQSYPDSVAVENGFGLTPLAEAKTMNHPKMDGVIKILEKAKRDYDKKKLKAGGTSIEDVQLQSKVVFLQNKIDHLEKTLSKVTILGKEMKSDLKRKKDSTEIMQKFSQALIELGSRTTQTPYEGGGGAAARSTTMEPLKSSMNSSSSSPPPAKSKGLFGRARTSRLSINSSNKAK